MITWITSGAVVSTIAYKWCKHMNSVALWNFLECQFFLIGFWAQLSWPPIFPKNSLSYSINYSTPFHSPIHSRRSSELKGDRWRIFIDAIKFCSLSTGIGAENKYVLVHYCSIVGHTGNNPFKTSFFLSLFLSNLWETIQRKYSFFSRNAPEKKLEGFFFR